MLSATSPWPTTAKHVVEALQESERRKYTHEYFDNHYWREDHGQSDPSLRFCYHDPNHQERFNFLAQLLIEVTEPTFVLDAGCGEGRLVSELRAAGVGALGFDVSPAGVSRALRHCHGAVFQAAVENMPVPSRAIDVVFCSDVLEHISIVSIWQAVSEIVRVTRRLVVATINTSNPYLFHPTILSRSSWNALFMLTGQVEVDEDLTGVLQHKTRLRHPEYEFFVFKRLEAALR